MRSHISTLFGGLRRKRMNNFVLNQLERALFWPTWFSAVPKDRWSTASRWFSLARFEPTQQLRWVRLSFRIESKLCQINEKVTSFVRCLLDAQVMLAFLHQQVLFAIERGRVKNRFLELIYRVLNCIVTTLIIRNKTDSFWRRTAIEDRKRIDYHRIKAPWRAVFSCVVERNLPKMTSLVISRFNPSTSNVI
jgi:hypothetical protein